MVDKILIRILRYFKNDVINFLFLVYLLYLFSCLLPEYPFSFFPSDEDKATTAEDADTVDAGEEPTSGEGYVRKEIKTVAEETSIEHVAVKRSLDMPPALENDTKKRRVDLPFIQKGNRGNEMDILEALQGNLSSPSPTPSPDIWSSAKTFEIPPTSSIPRQLQNPNKGRKRQLLGAKKQERSQVQR